MARPTDRLIDGLRRKSDRNGLGPGSHDHAYIRRLRRAFDEVAASG